MATCWNCDKEAKKSLHGIPLCGETKCKSALVNKAKQMALSSDAGRNAMREAYTKLSDDMSETESV